MRTRSFLPQDLLEFHSSLVQYIAFKLVSSELYLTQWLRVFESSKGKKKRLIRFLLGWPPLVRPRVSSEGRNGDLARSRLARQHRFLRLEPNFWEHQGFYSGTISVGFVSHARRNRKGGTAQGRQTLDWIPQRTCLLSVVVGHLVLVWVVSSRISVRYCSRGS